MGTGTPQGTLIGPARALALGTLLAVIVLATMNVAPLSVLAVGGAGLLMATNCLRPRDALASLDSSVLLLIAASIPLRLAQLVEVLQLHRAAKRPVQRLHQRRRVRERARHQHPEHIAVERRPRLGLVPVVGRHLADGAIRKVIHIPDRLLNIVVA